MSDLKRSLITFTSIHRTSSSESTSHFNIDLGEQIETQNVISCQLKNMSFVNAHYNINQHNNVFTYSDGVIKTVTILEGQYNLTEVLDALTTAFGLVGVVVVLSINEPTKRVSVDSCVPPCDFFDVQGNIVNFLGRALGIVGSTGLVGSTLFEDLPDISGLYQLNIHSRRLIDGSSIEVITEFDSQLNKYKRSPFMGDCIKTIPVNVPFGYQMIYENSDSTDLITYSSERNLKHIDIDLRDVNNKTIDLHGTHVTMTFLVEHLG